VPLIHRLVHLIQATRHASFETPLFQYAAQSRLGHDDGPSDSSQFHSCQYAILAIHAPDPTISTYPPMHPQCQHRQATSRPCTKPKSPPHDGSTWLYMALLRTYTDPATTTRNDCHTLPFTSHTHHTSISRPQLDYCLPPIHLQSPF
jgi:hypothetical protein